MMWIILTSLDTAMFFDPTMFEIIFQVPPFEI